MLGTSPGAWWLPRRCSCGAGAILTGGDPRNSLGDDVTVGITQLTGGSIRTHLWAGRVVATGLLSTVALVAATTGVAAADRPGLDSTDQIIEAVTGVVPEVVTSEIHIGDVLTVDTAAEVDTTYLVDTGEVTSVVASSKVLVSRPSPVT